MSDNTLYGHLSERFLKTPEDEFLRDGAGTIMSYGDLHGHTARFASAITALGVKPGDRVAAQVDKSTEALLVYLGAVRAGAVFLPLNTAYTPAELSYFLGDAEPALVLCDPDKIDEISVVAAHAEVACVETLGSNGEGTFQDAVMAASGEFADVPRGDDDIAAILYTSGTTGRSKGAMLTHGNLASNASALVETWKFSKSDRLLHALPIYHTHGLFTATNTVLASAASMIFLPRFNASEVLSLIGDATVMMGVPTFYYRLLQEKGLTRESVSHMRLFISGSAPLSREIHAEFARRTGHAILERYGMTETSMITSNPYDGERRAGTVGFPLPGIEVRIADTGTGAGLPQGEVGAIEVRGPNVFKGYWRMPDKTRDEFRPDGYFITGDLGMVDAQGYINIVGRDKDLIISGGFNVYPAEVEAAIDTIRGVAESAVIGLPHPDFGECVTAVVARNETGGALSETAIIECLQAGLAKFKQPKRVFFVDSLPRNSMGKVQKKELRDEYRDAFTGK